MLPAIKCHNAIEYHLPLNATMSSKAAFRQMLPAIKCRLPSNAMTQPNDHAVECHDAIECRDAVECHRMP